MPMFREVLLFLYENSPNAMAYFNQIGMYGRPDPLAYVDRIDTPASLDHVASIYEAYRNICMQINTSCGDERQVTYVSGFTEQMLSTMNMYALNIATQRKWYEAFQEAKTAVKEREKTMANEQKAIHALRNKDPAEAEARCVLNRIYFSDAIIVLITPDLPLEQAVGAGSHDGGGRQLPGGLARPGVVPVGLLRK